MPNVIENTSTEIHLPVTIPQNRATDNLDRSVHDCAMKSYNLCWEFLQLGIKKEELYVRKLFQYSNEAGEIQKAIEQVIQVNGMLPLSDKSTTLSDDVIQAIQKLEKHSIHLLKENEKKISPERMAEIKTTLGTHLDRLKTELQNKFSTKIQVTINEINSLLDTIRSTIKYADRLMATIIGNQRKS